MRLTAADLYRYSGKPYKVTVFLSFFLTHPGFRFIAVMRMCQRFSKGHPIGLFSRMYYKHLQIRFGFQIPHTCNIQEGLFLGHFGNIVVNQGVEIGRNCNIAQGVTVGYISRGTKKGCPKIGDRVWIGPNAVIVGNITIGNDVLVAPLSLINFDVPDNSVVQGNPARVINTQGSAGYIKNYDGSTT